MGTRPYLLLLSRMTVRLGMVALHAWLILAQGVPTPLMLSAGITTAVNSAREDSPQDKAPPVEEKEPKGTLRPQDPSSGRSRVLRSSGDPFTQPWLSKSSRVPSHPKFRRDLSGHFLADGRSLRDWLQSQTC